MIEQVYSGVNTPLKWYFRCGELVLGQLSGAMQLT